MKAPICNVCVSSGILCPACQDKLNTGEVSQLDIDVTRLIEKEGEVAKTLKDVEIKKVLEAGDMAIIICSKGSAPKLVGKGGIIVKKLSKVTGKNFRVVEESSDARTFLQNLVFPTPILSLNTIVTNKGEKCRIVMPKNSRLFIPKASLLAVAKKFLGKEIEIGFE